MAAGAPRPSSTRTLAALAAAVLLSLAGASIYLDGAAYVPYRPADLTIGRRR